MPHTRNAKKRLRQNTKKRLLNRATVKAIKTQIKKLKDIVADGNMDQAHVELNVLAQKVDKAAARKIVHSNLAARTVGSGKIRLAKFRQIGSNRPRRRVVGGAGGRNHPARAGCRYV